MSAVAKKRWPQGTPVMCNGYRGVIVRHYDGNTYEIRVLGGVVATDDFTVIISPPKDAPPCRHATTLAGHCVKCGIYPYDQPRAAWIETPTACVLVGQPERRRPHEARGSSASNACFGAL